MIPAVFPEQFTKGQIFSGKAFFLPLSGKRAGPSLFYSGKGFAKASKSPEAQSRTLSRDL